MKLEKKYEDEKKYEEGFKYTLKICKLNSNDMYYNIKAGSILGKEGYYILACDYFNKALLNKNEFDTEDIKTAAFCFFNNKNYKKSIVFLEELHNRLNKDKNENPKLYDELNYLNKSLISMYILSDELKIAESFTEKIISEKNIDDSIKLNIDRIYMHILYKLSENGKFKEVYDNFYVKYNIKNFDKKVPNLILDYCFYSYFLKDTELAIKLFEYIKSLNIEEFSIYNFESILKYLSDINKATLHLNKLRNIMKLENVKNDNYEKYVETENIENWERSVDLWEGSFINIDYLTSLIEIKKTMDVEKILDELKIEQNNNSKDMSLKIVQKVDKIYNMNIIDFKKLCKNIIRTKLSYSIIQEYMDNADGNDYGDEVNYLTYHNKASKKDITLISFKRWKKIEAGELIIRDFLMMVSESGAKNGILILPVQLSSSAKSYASHNNKVTVYSRNQFNNLLKDEKI